MKVSMTAALVASASLVTALPAAQKSTPPAEGQLVPTSSNMLGTIAKLTNSKGLLDAGLRPLISNEVLDESACGKVTFIFARASSEPNNMGGSVGPWLCAGLKKAYGAKQVLCQGVGENGGNGYTASIAGNMNTIGSGTTAAAVTEATRMFTKAVAKCPKSALVFGGYSQGTAVMHATVSKLPANIKEKIVAGVLYGDTRNVQDGGKIPNFPKEKTKIWCASDDGVCKGTLLVTNGHFVYTMNGDAEAGVDFLKSKIGAAGKGATEEVVEE